MNNCKENKKKYILGPVATQFGSSNTGSWRIVRPVVNQEECILCKTCEKHCPTDVMTVTKTGSDKGVTIDMRYCKGCGICANVCPKKCISMVDERGVRE